MKQKNHKTLIALVGGLFLFTTGNSLATDYRPAMLANPCAGCHGPDGASPGPIPPLKGLPGSYIISAMQAFKTDQRQGTVMNRIAKGYTDEEIKLMAGYFEAGR
ncbi:MAG: cytochrome c [Gammaproteobacteria bacterium]|nr:cytochrome c [Gammaproteobacteria bacterium]